MQGPKTVSKTHEPAQNPTRHKADMKLHTEDTKSTVFARVICALFFIFWPLKNRGA